MQLSFKEILLKRISKKDNELLRTWRNSEFISNKMFFQKKISKEMQTEWFESLSSENDFYFLIQYQQENIGLINLKNIDWKQKEGEAGLYIAIEKYRNSPLAIYASMAFLTYFFEEKGLDNIFAKVRKDNLSTIQYNKDLGFIALEKELFSLTREKYFEITKKLQKRIL